MELNGKTVNFLGDSITQGVGASSYEKCFVSLFAKAHPNTKVNNYGIGGTRITPQRVPSEVARWDLDFLGRADDMDESADLICVYGGVNDHAHGDAPFGKFGDDTPETFCGALRCLTLKLLNKYPDKRIAFFTPLHRVYRVPGVETAPKSPDHRPLYDYVQEIRRNAEYFSLPVLDLWATAGMQPEVPVINATYFADGIHPNDFGYERLFHLVDKFIESL